MTKEEAAAQRRASVHAAFWRSGEWRDQWQIVWLEIQVDILALRLRIAEERLRGERGDA